MPARSKIRIKHCQPEDWPAGWYVQVRGAFAWEAIEQLRFVRERDAALAMRALVLAKLDTKRRVQQDAENAVRVAFEALQW